MDLKMGMHRAIAAGFFFALILINSACSHQDWSKSDRSSAGLAPIFLT